MAHIQKVIIIGAGPAGLLAALRLHKHNDIVPVVYEIRPEPSTLGGAIGIPSNGSRLLHRLGLYEACCSRGAETSNLVVHSLDGSVMGQMDMTSRSRQVTGFGYLRIRRTDLMDVLYDAIAQEGIRIHFGKHLVKIEENEQGVTTIFSDDTVDTADLLLGCDGIHSSVRRMYVDPDKLPEYSGISSMFSLLPTANLPTIASSMDALNVTLTADGMVALSPCTSSGNMIYWFFSREIVLPPGEDTRDGWEEQGKKEVSNFKSNLFDLIHGGKGEWGELMIKVVSQTEVLKFYPVFRLGLGGKWYKGRCLIIGDAAHAMQPHASQGVSMALEDVFLLSNSLKSHRSLSDVFNVYEEKRRPRVDMFYKTAERNGDMRKKMSPFRFWIQEQVMSTALSLYGVFNLDKLGLGQKPLAYDVEAEDV
ncbi:FAD binding domain protein [Talaromyces proteolyticus]|uniref:FAD binding domain protein n=1 Tax=Talaromyces proteolyticus TaxID=1131652 RepID=A0AAD4KS17_9EURO|nr:FAD binding domain protein [Talaromyces proteolyticus]KAH8695661.1 FAD binding domain protein [Talaromyces proteolyticus]